VNHPATQLLTILTGITRSFSLQILDRISCRLKDLSVLSTTRPSHDLLVGNGFEGSNLFRFIGCSKSYTLVLHRARTCRHLSEKRNRSIRDRRSRFHTLKEACSIGAAGMIPYAHASNEQWSLQACSFVFPGGGLVDSLLRASNEALPRARVPRAGGGPGRPPFCFRAPRKGCRGRRRSERLYASFVLIAKV
jgi:hypothetical protein